MALISFTPLQDGVTGVNGAATNTPLSTIYNDYNGNITDANIAAAAAIAQSKLSLSLAGAKTSEVATSETTTSTSFTDLATVQSVTVIVGASGFLLVGYGAQNTSAVLQYMAPALSGANTYAANVADFAGTAANNSISRSKLFTGLAAGSTVVTLKFHVDTGTGTWLRRNLWAIPL